MAKLPERGVQLIAKGVDNFVRQLDLADKALIKLDKSVADAAKRSSFSSYGKTFNKIGQVFDRFMGRLQSHTGDISKALGLFGGRFKDLSTKLDGALPGLKNLTQGLAGIPPPALAAAAGIAVATAAVAGFIALGTRGATFKGIIQSFEVLANRAGLVADTLRNDLRQAAGGTISDMELMRQANIALAGATGKFAQEFGSKLPQVLEVARVQARATGQSVDFLFQSLVTGIKRSSPLLIDNTGLVLKVGEANRKYAESIGKTVSELTAEEQQIALLNATLEAGGEAVQLFGNVQETASDKIDRMNATITNILDRLALAVQPAFEFILDIINGVLDAISDVVDFFAPIIEGILTIIVGVFRAIGAFLGATVRPAFQIIIDVIRGVVSFIFEMGQKFLLGGARLMGALVAGIAGVANAVLFPLIIGIADTIASFLVGQSPPPKGPLSEIDKGGQRTMEAWVAGFASASIDPVEQVIAEVQSALGDVASQTIRQVQARLAELDKAVAPFQQRLSIVEATFKSINTHAEAALKAIDRQLETAQQALAAGDESAAETIRRLDAQRAAIQSSLDMQQKQVDNAKIQLALVEAQQARERALLNIRKEQIGVVARAAGSVGAGGGTKSIKSSSPSKRSGGRKTQTPKPKKRTGGKRAPAPSEPVPETADTGLETTAPLSGVEKFGLELAQNFLEPIAGADGPMAEFNSNVSELEGIFSRVSDGIAGNASGGIVGAFQSLQDGITDVVGGIWDDTLRPIFQPIIDFLNGEGDLNIQDAIDAFIATVGALPQAAADAIGDIWETYIAPQFDGLVRFFTGGESGADVDTLPGIINSGVEFVRGIGDRIATAIGDIWETNVQPIFQSFVDFFTGGSSGIDPGTIPGIINTATKILQTLGSNIESAIGDIWETNVQPIFQSFIDFFTGGSSGIDPGTIPGMVNDAVVFFETLGRDIAAAIGDIWTTHIQPIFQPLIDFLSGVSEDGIQFVIDGFIDFFRDLGARIITVLGLDTVVSDIRNFATDLASYVETTFNDVVNTIRRAIEDIELLLLNTEAQALATLEAAGLGGNSERLLENSRRIRDIQTTRQIEEIFNQQINTGDLDLQVPITFTVGGQTGTFSIFEGLNSEEFVQSNADRLRPLVREAIETALRGGDTETVAGLSTAAELLGIDTESISADIEAQTQQMRQSMIDSVTGLWSETIQPQLQPLIDFFGGVDQTVGLPVALTNTTESVSDFAANFGDTMNSIIEDYVQPFADRMTNIFGIAAEGENGENGEGVAGGIQTGFDKLIGFLGGVGSKISSALGNVGGFLWDAMAEPTESVINAMVSAINDFIAGAIQAFVQFSKIMGITIDANTLRLPPVTIPRPASLRGARDGGLFSGGALRVHKGEQVISSPASNRLSVFPQNVVRSLDVIASVMARPATQYALASGGTSQQIIDNSSRDLNMNNVFNQPMNPTEVVQRMSLMRVMR